MEEQKLFDAEYKLMLIIWEKEPINSTDLVKICEEELGWKKSTTYTVLRKLKERNFLNHIDAVVSSKVMKKDVLKYESEALLSKVFGNSLPLFLTAFLGDKKISPKEVDELIRIIDSSKGDE